MGGIDCVTPKIAITSDQSIEHLAKKPSAKILCKHGQFLKKKNNLDDSSNNSNKFGNNESLYRNSTYSFRVLLALWDIIISLITNR